MKATDMRDWLIDLHWIRTFDGTFIVGTSAVDHSQVLFAL